jgi:hypothetical protein
VLVLGAALWIIRAGDVFVDRHEPTWLFGIAALQVIAATLLMVNIGPAKFIAQAVAAIHIGLCLLLAGQYPLGPHSVASAGVGLVLILMTAGEPSALRRNAGLGLATLCAIASVAISLIPSAPPTVRPLVVLEDPRVGYQLTMPEGWKKMTADELAPYLPLPVESLENKYVGFGTRIQRTWGLLTLSSDEKIQLIGGCQEQHQRIGSVNDAVPIDAVAPKVLGKQSLVFEVRTASGAVGRLACGRVGNRFVALALVGLDPSPGVLEVTFEKIGAGLIVR